LDGIVIPSAASHFSSSLILIQLPDQSYQEIESPKLEDHLTACSKTLKLFEHRLIIDAMREADANWHPRWRLPDGGHSGDEYDDDSIDCDDESNGPTVTSPGRKAHPLEKIASKLSEMKKFLDSVYWCPPVYMSAMNPENTQCFCPCSGKMSHWRDIFSLNIEDGTFPKCGDVAFDDTRALFRHCMNEYWRQECLHHLWLANYLYHLFPFFKNLRRSARKRKCGPERVSP
jgi:hypothetical protein